VRETNPRNPVHEDGSLRRAVKKGDSVSKLRKLIGSAFFVLLISVTCFAQDGIITGKVADASGAVLPGVTITVAGSR